MKCFDTRGKCITITFQKLNNCTKTNKYLNDENIFIYVAKFSCSFLL